MSEPFVGEITIFAGNYAPRGWAACNGQLLPVQQNAALFSLLGVLYGGDGRNNFGLPNLMGRAPMHAGDGPGLTPRNQGVAGGQATVTLLTSEMPSHSHDVACVSTAGNQGNPEGKVWGPTPPRSNLMAYTSATPDVTMSPQVLLPRGGGQPHNNRQPYLGLNFIIALQGVFPTRD